MALPKIELSPNSPVSDAFVLAWWQAQDDKGQLRLAGKSGKESDLLLNRLLEAKYFAGKKGEVSLVRFHAWEKSANLLLLGLGKEKAWTTEVARQVGASLYSAQKRERLSTIALTPEFFSGAGGEGTEEAFFQAFCEGYFLASYGYDELKKKPKEVHAPKGLIFVGGKSSALKSALKKAEVLGEAVCFARLLGDKPGNYLTPTIFSKLVSQMCGSRKLKCTVMGRTQIEKEKMGLFLGVAQGSEEEPKFIMMDYKGGKKGDRPIALVGKGITFDSGGISIKPAGQMEEMKYDMMGAAAVAGAMQAIADLKLPINVMGFIAATENMPSGAAQKPGDVQKSSRGKTVEIVNTDAEGRLILADALEYAQKFEPQAILDFATLTGAVIVALGHSACGIMGTSQPLIDRIKASSAATGERVWQLPLFEEFEDDLKSSYADIRNSGSRDAGSSKGGTFLKFFVDEKYPWVHVDIAGAAWFRKDVNYHQSKYASGVMVRLIAHLLEHWSPLS